ncbi:MAG: hypothetical protein ACJ8J0_05730, partial [Longimicrobiaceae bacterium]
VSRDIGMSPMGLRNFLEGASPYSNTLKKIAHWYLRFVYLEAPKRVSGWDLVGTEADEDAPHEPQSLDETEEEEGETDEQ